MVDHKGRSEAGGERDLRLFTQAEVEAVSGTEGNFDVSVKLSPRFVNEKCTACGKCAEACSAEIDNPFNYGMDKIKAAYLPHEMAFPMRYVLDPGFAKSPEAKKVEEACPYGARHFNWAEPNLPKDQMNPVTHYLGNRPRSKGVVEKCTFCVQRTRQGRYPACVEICPVGARKFGNLLDPDSEIRRVMETKRVFIFKEELATHPQFFYFYAT
jgi:Fe-S-cluster-containing dehydrogenase component